MATVQDMICKPFSVFGDPISAEDIAKAIDALADAPSTFIAQDLAYVLPGRDFVWKQEALNRLMQRWRKLGLATFKAGRWTLTKGAWNQMQTAARNVRIPA